MAGMVSLPRVGEEPHPLLSKPPDELVLSLSVLC